MLALSTAITLALVAASSVQSVPASESTTLDKRWGRQSFYCPGKVQNPCKIFLDKCSSLAGAQGQGSSSEHIEASCDWEYFSSKSYRGSNEFCYDNEGNLPHYTNNGWCSWNDQGKLWGGLYNKRQQQGVTDVSVSPGKRCATCGDNGESNDYAGSYSSQGYHSGYGSGYGSGYSSGYGSNDYSSGYHSGGYSGGYGSNDYSSGGYGSNDYSSSGYGSNDYSSSGFGSNDYSGGYHSGDYSNNHRNWNSGNRWNQGSDYVKSNHGSYGYNQGSDYSNYNRYNQGYSGYNHYHPSSDYYRGGSSYGSGGYSNTNIDQTIRTASWQSGSNENCVGNCQPSCQPCSGCRQREIHTITSFPRLVRATCVIRQVDQTQACGGGIDGWYPYND